MITRQRDGPAAFKGFPSGHGAPLPANMPGRRTRKVPKQVVVKPLPASWVGKKGSRRGLKRPVGLCTMFNVQRSQIVELARGDVLSQGRGCQDTVEVLARLANASNLTLLLTKSRSRKNLSRMNQL